MSSKHTSHELEWGLTEKQFKIGKPLVGSLPYFRPDPIKFLMGLSRFGDVTETRFGPYKIVLVNHVSAIKHVLHTNNKNYLKSPFLDVVKLVLGEGLLTAEGKKWAKDRRIIHQAFLQGNFSLYGQWITGLVQETMKDWNEIAAAGKEVDVSSEMMNLTFSVICKSLFSTVNKEFVDAVENAMPILLRYVEHANNTVIRFPLSVPTKRNREFKQALKSIQDISRKIILEHQASPDKYNDLLSLMLKTRDTETGEGLSLKDIEDHIITLFLAGHETTAICMTWTWYLLGTHPNILKRLRQELDEVLSADACADHSHLEKLSYTRQVIEESMRLYPPAWEFDRLTVNEDSILGNKIPKGSIVMICPYLIHRDPRFWDNPLQFRPERFAPENQDKIVPYSYIPFGAGPRACIGKNFALMEAILILANLAHKFDVEVSPFPEPARETLMTMRPKHGLKVKIKQRGF